MEPNLGSVDYVSFGFLLYNVTRSNTCKGQKLARRLVLKIESFNFILKTIRFKRSPQKGDFSQMFSLKQECPSALSTWFQWSARFQKLLGQFQTQLKPKSQLRSLLTELSLYLAGLMN